MTMSNNKLRLSLIKWFAWGFCALTALATVWVIGDALFRLTGHAGLIKLLSEALLWLVPLAFAVLAALIVTRQPGNVMGWLMMLPVLGGLLAIVSEAYLQNITAPPSAPSFLLLLMLWFDNTSWVVIFFPILLIPLLFPTGRPPSQRWNWVIGYAVALVLIFFFIAVTAKDWGPPDGGWLVRNPIGFISADTLDQFFGLPWTIGFGLLILISMAAFFVRYRRGSSLEKAQIKWVVYACTFFGIFAIIDGANPDP